MCVFCVHPLNSGKSIAMGSLIKLYGGVCVLMGEGREGERERKRERKREEEKERKRYTPGHVYTG